jgi:hypothetical protein
MSADAENKRAAGSSSGNNRLNNRSKVLNRHDVGQ